MQFRILGPLEVRHAGSVVDLGPPKQRALLAMLLLHAGDIVSVDRLAAAWLLRNRLPELSLWLLAETALLVVSNEAVASRRQNFARVAPFAMAALALAVAHEARQRARPLPGGATSPSAGSMNGKAFGEQPSKTLGRSR